MGHRAAKEFKVFEEKILRELPVERADIVNLEVQIKEGYKNYLISFVNQQSIDCTYSAYEDNLKVHLDLADGEKPYLTFKYLNDDVVFPDDNELVVLHGVYCIEIHVTKGMLNI